MIVAPFSGVASATACTYRRSCWSSEMTRARLSLRAATAPVAFVRARVSAVCSSLTAAERAASAGTGAGNAGLLVIACTMPVPYAMKSATLAGSLSETVAR
jgi:hypothetical protein